MQTPNADIPTVQTAPTSVGGRVVSGIREAAESIGVSFDYLLAQATQESGLDPHARNTRSTAAGLFQFTAPTWLEMVMRHGADHGLGDQAAAITKTADGHLDVKDKAARKAILDLRKDPKLSSIMAAEYAKDNAKVLEGRLGRPATASDLYLAHFLGAGGAARVLEGMEDNPRHSAQRLLPEAARANPEVFHEPGSRRSRTVAGLYKSVQARFNSALNGDAGQPALTGNPQLAALRPLPRPDREEPTATAVGPVKIAQADPAPDTTAPPQVTAALRQQALSAFAAAIQPESPFFPAAIPPAPPPRPPSASGAHENLSLRDIVESVKAGEV